MQHAAFHHKLHDHLSRNKQCAYTHTLGLHVVLMGSGVNLLIFDLVKPIFLI